MNSMDYINSEVIIGFFAVAGAMIAFLIGIVFLIVRLVKKEKVRGSMITLAVAFVVFLTGAFISVKGFMKIQSELSEDYTASQIEHMDQKDDPYALDDEEFSDSKVTLLNFWEPWCGPCKEEMPDIEALYEKYKDSGFNVIGVYSTEDGVEDVVKDLGITYEVHSIGDKYDILKTAGAVPCSVFVDSAGKILVPDDSVTMCSSILKDSKAEGSSAAKEFYSRVIVGYRSAEIWEVAIESFLK